MSTDVRWETINQAGARVLVTPNDVPASVRRWDEPAQASTPRGWLHLGGVVVGFYLDYGPDHYRIGHEYCAPPACICRDCQPGHVLAVRYPGGKGADTRARYVGTVAQAREYVESGELAAGYVVTFNPRPVTGPGAIKGLRRMSLADARDLVADAVRTGRIVNAETLETV